MPPAEMKAFMELEILSEGVSPQASDAIVEGIVREVALTELWTEDGVRLQRPH